MHSIIKQLNILAEREEHNLNLKSGFYLCRIERAQIEIPQQHCLTERGHIVGLGTLFAVPACANFKVERTIYFVFFRAKY